jgi:hypothetical protein
MDLFIVPTIGFDPALCLRHRPAGASRACLDLDLETKAICYWHLIYQFGRNGSASAGTNQMEFSVRPARR